jgi:rhodanese-related sulfurtransferase
MTAVSCQAAIDVQELSAAGDLAFRCIDVRSATEFAAGHIPGAINIPMDEIESRLGDLRPGQPTLLVCQAGKRASMTHALLAGRVDDLYVLSGGTDAWIAAGLPLVASTRTRWSLERQVRLGAGLLVLAGVLLGFLVNSGWFWLAGFAGTGLVVAGTTNFCAMAHLLALLPWNRRGSSIECSCPEPDRNT